jgi:4-amino-4-deoxy-L-arabinose transferase-like glycosyltransferase
MPRIRITLIVIFVVALGVRLAYLDSSARSRNWGGIEGEMARNIIAHGRWFQLRGGASGSEWISEIVEPVGESLVLVGSWEVTGSERLLPDQLLKIVSDALTALLIYRVAMELFGRSRTALLAAALYAIYPPIAWLTTAPYMDIWAVDLTIAILALQLQAARSPNHWRWLILCGLIVGFGTYFRPFLLVVSATLTVVLNISAGKRAALVRATATTAVALVLVIPWTVRNYNAFHAFIPFRSGLGQTLWEGLGELHNNFGATFGGLGTTATERMVHRERPALVVESPPWDNFLMHKAVRAIERHPLFYGELLLYRTAQATVWSSSPTWMHRGAVSPLSYKAGPLVYAIERPFNLLEDLLEPVVFLLAVLSVALTWRRWRKAHTILIAVVLATIVPYIPLLVEHRYIVPAAFAYLIWIALGADLLVERWRTGRDSAISMG